MSYPRPIKGESYESVLKQANFFYDQYEKVKARLESQLAECYRQSGADPDGNEDWRLAPHAVSEVTRMRKEYDTLDSKIVELETRIEQLKQESINAAVHCAELEKVAREMRDAFGVRPDEGGFVCNACDAYQQEHHVDCPVAEFDALMETKK